MKVRWKCSLAVVLVLVLAAPTLALGENLEEVAVKLQVFLDGLIAQGTPVDEKILSANAAALERGAEETYIEIFYSWAKYVFITAEGYDLEFAYTMAFLHGKESDDVDADALYAQYISACTGVELSEAVDAVAWLREYMVRTGLSDFDSAKTVGDYTVTLSSWTDDPEEYLNIYGFGDK